MVNHDLDSESDMTTFDLLDPSWTVLPGLRRGVPIRRVSVRRQVPATPESKHALVCVADRRGVLHGDFARNWRAVRWMLVAVQSAVWAAALCFVF